MINSFDKRARLEDWLHEAIYCHEKDVRTLSTALDMSEGSVYTLLHDIISVGNKPDKLRKAKRQARYKTGVTAIDTSALRGFAYVPVDQLKFDVYGSNGEVFIVNQQYLKAMYGPFKSNKEAIAFIADLASNEEEFFADNAKKERGADGD